MEEHCYKFLKTDFWLPNSPDLSPCDYAIWATLEAKIWKHNRFQITTLKILKNGSLKNGRPYRKMLFPEQSTRLKSVFAWSLRRMVDI